MRGSGKNCADWWPGIAGPERNVFSMSGLRIARTSWGFAVCLGFAKLDDERAFGVVGGFRAYVFEAIMPVIAEEVEAEAVVFGVDLLN